MTNPFSQFNTTKQSEDSNSSSTAASNPFSQFSASAVNIDDNEQEIINQVNSVKIQTPETFGLTSVSKDLGKGLARGFAEIPQYVGGTLVEVGETADAFKGKSAFDVAKRSFVNRFIENMGERDKTLNVFEMAGMVFGTAKDVALNLAFDEEGSKVIAKAGYNMIKENEQSLKSMGLLPQGDSSVAYDVGRGFSSALTSIGATVITKNPAVASGIMGWMANSGDYMEARQAGKTPEEAAAIAASSAAGQAAIEYVGGKFFLDAAKKSTFIKSSLKRILGQSVEEVGQSFVEQGIKQVTDVRDSTASEIAQEALYAGLIGAMAGAPVATIATGVESYGKSLGLKEEEAKKVGKIAEEKYSDLEDLGAAFMDRETTGLGTDPAQIEESKKAMAEVLQKREETIDIDMEAFMQPQNRLENDLQQAMDSLGKLEETDTSNLSIDEADKVRAEIASLESVVDQRLEEIRAQNNEGRIPVGKKPETLSKFLKRMGGIKPEAKEALRYTRKESPDLHGVVNKNGKLSLDEARELAVDNGFIVDDGLESGGVATTTEFDVLDALEREASGDIVVRPEDYDVELNRQQTMELNSQLEQQNSEIAANAKQLKSFKSAFKDGVSAARKDVKKAQEALISALNAAKLRPEDKAKFISTIKNTQTIEKLRKSADKIEERVLGLLESESKRNFRKKIAKVISSAKKRKDLSVDVIDDIRALESDFKSSGILGAGMKETPLDDFQTAYESAVELTLQAKEKLELTKMQKAARFEQRLEELKQDSVPLGSRSLKEASLNETLSAADKMKNLYIEGANKVQRFNINKNPMDVIFDVMDGGKDYDGANSRIFKKTIDRAHSKYLQLRENTTRDVKNLADKLNLKEVNYKRIGAWAALQQEGGRDKLLATGITKKELAELSLSDAEMQMYSLMRTKLDSLRPAIKKVMRVAYNKDFSNVKDYFPFMTDFKAMKDFEIQNMMGEDALVISDNVEDFNKKDVKKGFTKERTLGKQKIRIDALNIFLNHVDNAAYLVGMGQDIKELGELAQSQEFRQTNGELGQQVVSDWIDLLARKGQASGQNDFLNALRVNAGAAVLGFKLSSALIQPTALMDGAALIGGSYVARGVKNVTNADWRKFMRDNMPEVRQRVGDDPNYLDMGGNGLLAKQREAGFYVLQKLDLLAASSVASGAYVKSVEERGGKVDLSNPDPVAIEYAQLMMRRTQSSSFAKDAAPIISQGKFTGNVSIDKIIFQFQSFMFNRWSIIQHDIVAAGFKRGKTKQAVNAAMFLMLANLSEYHVRRWTKELVSSMFGNEVDDKDEDKEAEEIIARQMLSNVPIVSSLVSSAQYGSVPVPSISLVEGIFERASYLNKAKNTETQAKQATLLTIEALGLGLGISGTLQAKQFLQEATKKPTKSSASTL